MPHYLPDAQAITEYCGAYEARGCHFEVVQIDLMGGYALRMDFGPKSAVSPFFPLPADEMQTPEAARRWMAHLRDKHLSQFDRMLRWSQPAAE